MVAISTLLLVVALSLLITRIATVVLTATGMSRQSARFQARSAFTGAGFTTSESEKVVDHPVRRRVIMWMMLLGNVGIVATASSAILGLRNGGLAGTGWRMLELVLGLLLLVFVSRSKWVDTRLTRLISRLLHQYTDLPTRDQDSLLELPGSFAVIELAIRPGDWTVERSLAELDLSAEGLTVLGVTRADGTYLGVVRGSTTLHEGDLLILYGEESRLKELDSRPAGPEGDHRHAAAMLEEQSRLSNEPTSPGRR